jgi:hypothetical protein
MSVAIRCGIKVDGIRKMSKSMCCPPKYNKKNELVKGCTMWDECQIELKQGIIDLYEDSATEEEINSGRAFQDLDGLWRIYRKI